MIFYIGSLKKVYKSANFCKSLSKTFKLFIYWVAYLSYLEVKDRISSFMPD